jgi:hypothetical protein
MLHKIELVLKEMVEELFQKSEVKTKDDEEEIKIYKKVEDRDEGE